MIKLFRQITDGLVPGGASAPSIIYSSDKAAATVTGTTLKYVADGNANITASLDSSDHYTATDISQSITVTVASGGGDDHNQGGDTGTELTEQNITFHGTVKTSYDYGDSGDTISVNNANTTVTYGSTEEDVATIG